MPPKAKILKEDIIKTAIEMVKSGVDLNARSIALRLKCSTQPVFSNFATMEDLKNEVLKKCEEIYTEFTEKEIQKKEFPIYKTIGMAYIQFAKEEKELFKLMYMCKRKSGDDFSTASFEKSIQLLCEMLNLTEENARLFQLEMWAFVHGIAAMHATDFLELDRELISKMLTDNFKGLKTQFVEKDKSWI